MKPNYRSILLACVGLTLSASVSAKTIREFAEAGEITWTGASATYLTVGDNEELLLEYRQVGEHKLHLDDSIEVTADWLVVGGGGAGGTMKPLTAKGADGGDAGEVKYTENGTLRGYDYDIYVGKGGERIAVQTAEERGGSGEYSYVLGGPDMIAADGGYGGKALTGQGVSKDGVSHETTTAITGETAVYGLGGKGGAAAGTHDGDNGAANTGNGGGGGDAGYLGGNGGSGVVILRLKSAVAHATTGPDLKDLTYTGENQIGIEAHEGYTIDATSVTNATNAGSYVAKVTPAAGWWWKDDKKTDEREFVWTIKPREIEKPTATPAEIVYDGSEHTVEKSESDAYTYIEEETVTTATTVGEYALTAKLNNLEGGATNYVWKGESEYSPIAVGTWTIKPVTVTRPTITEELIYTGSEQTPYTYAEPMVVKPATGKTTAEDKATEAGVHDFQLCPGPDDNYVWADTLDSEPWDVLWRILKASNEITVFNQLGWRLNSGEEPPAPVLEAKFGAATAVYSYAESEDAEEEAWTTEMPTTPGKWWIRATIFETPNYDGAAAKTSFIVWDQPSDVYDDSVTISFDYTGETLTDFVVPVRLSEASLPGFSYERVGDPETLGFISGDEILAYDVELWNPEGESIVWVKLPELKAGTTLTMWWHAKSELTLGGKDAAAVWSNYHGVWHFGETIDAETAAETMSADATGNGHDAKIVSYDTAGAPTSASISVAGVLGNARQTTDSPRNNGPRFELQDTANLPLGGSFTVSGWYNMRSLGSADSLALIARKTAQSASGEGGWYGQHNSSRNVSLYGQGGAAKGVSTAAIRNVAPNNAGWIYFAYVYDGTSLTVIQGNEGSVKVQQGEIDAATDNGMGISLGAYVYDAGKTKQSFAGYFDEVRISKAPLSEARLKAEESSMRADSTFVKYGLVSVNGKKLNYWVREPSITPTIWDISEHPTFAIDNGELAEGTSVVKYYRLEDPDTELVVSGPEDFTAAGQYLAIFSADDPEGLYQPISRTIQLALTCRSPYTDISGRGGDSGRVLLMNRDLNPLSPVDHQGFYDTNPSEASTYWEHGADVEYENSKFHLMAPTKSVLRCQDGSRLWTLVECRQGNVFPQNDAMPLPTNQVFLPWESPTAIRFDGRAEAATKRSDAGTLVMRNTNEAVVYSPVFTNGVGTIYFDAVNGWTSEDGAAYHLKVETSRFVATEDPTQVGEWESVPGVTLYKKDGTDGFVEERVEGGEFALAITHGGSVDNFYRVVVTLNTTEPVRFRIVRTTYDEMQESDSTRMISLDNLIVSYPPMRADLKPTGFFDATRRGKQTIGWECATETLYPSIGDKDLRVRTKMTSVVNPGAPVENPATFVASSVMHYRWRYLGARFSPNEGWRSVSLNPMADFRAARPLELPAEEGDVEFWYETLLSAPFYQYVDYTGLNLGVPFSEEVTIVTNRYEGVTLPSGGTDWFFRLRAGKSGYEGISMVVETEKGEAYETVPFELTRDGVWRGFLRTTEGSAGNYRYHFVATEPKDVLGVEAGVHTYTWRTVGEQTATPCALSFAQCNPDEWSPLSVDAKTGHLMFIINESSHSVSLAHADYQDFNRWNDAHRDGGIFVGSSTEGEKRVGASSEMRDFREEFIDWTDTPATSAYWREDFSSGSQLETFVPFREVTTPNGWVARQGMYVNHSWMDSTSGYALQLRGSGYGELEYPANVSNPRGLESIVYHARLGQQLAFTDFSYYDAGSRESRGMTNYTFVTQAAMSDVAWTGNHTANDFDGAGQISLVAAYQANRGCYELRVTRTARESMRLELYKWSMKNGAMVAERVAGPQNQNLITFHKWHGSNTSPMEYGTFYISVDAVNGGGQRITAGTCRSHSKFDVQPPQQAYTALRYYDNASTALNYGTYGVAATSCPALILAPRVYAASVPWDSTAPGQSSMANSVDIAFDETKRTDEPNDFADWAIAEGRTEVFADTENRVDRWGLKNIATPQKLLVQRQTSVEGETGKKEWVTLAERMVSGFSLESEERIEVYDPEDGIYRLVHGAEMDEARTDIIIDDVELRQWRGDDYGSVDTSSWCAPNDGYGYRNNFIFSSGWIRNNRVKLSAKRTLPSARSAIRSPLMDGNAGRGLGLGMISYAYENAQVNARVLIQVAEVDQASAIVDESAWETVAVTDFSTMSPQERAGGVINHYIGRHGVWGLVRIVIDPALSEEVKSERNLSRFGEIDITGVLVRDEPELDLRSWWGWNLRLVNGDKSSLWDDGTRSYLYDWGVHAGDMGFSLALNNSVEDDIDVVESDSYRKHMPFVQTPTFSDDIVGEITFKARKFDNENPQAAEVRLYGATTGDPNDPNLEWTELQHFVVSNATYTTYHHRLANGAYRAFRLGVTGVKKVDLDERGPDPSEGSDPVRVMIDELVVSEAVYPRLGFRYAYPTRTGLDTHTPSPVFDVMKGVPLCDEQPLLGENWTVQTELQVKQLPEEIDLDTPGREPQVYLYWYKGGAPWGFDQWKDDAAAKRAELVPVAGDAMTFRGSFREAPDAVVEESEDEGTIVQYGLTVSYYDREGVRHESVLERSEWTTPEWYNPIDYNEDSIDFSAFTIIESIAPHRAWINEVNVYDGTDRHQYALASTNQYIEIAVPYTQELNGWTLEYIDNGKNVYPLCTFGNGSANVTPSKVGPVTNDYTFVVVQSPNTADSTTWFNKRRPDGELVEMDGTWSDIPGDYGELDGFNPIALRLKRPSGIVATEIALEGTNFWASMGWEDATLADYVRELNEDAAFKKARFFAAGSEEGNQPKIGLEGQSLGVFEAIGANAECWNATMHQTPGWVNEGQQVPEGYVIYPNRAQVVLTAVVKGKGVTQLVEGREPTDETIRMTIPKNGPGVVLTYAIGKWHELKRVTENDVVLPGSEGKRDSFDARVGKDATANVTVIAEAVPRSDLGLDPDSPYADAVMDWLDTGKNYFGESFKNPGEIHAAEYWSLNPYVKQSELSLIDMYWLDIDPTEGNWRLEAGIVNVGTKAKPVEVQQQSRAKFAIGPTDPEGEAQNDVTQNLLVTIQMTITNLVSEVAYAPYLLRGREAGETSAAHSGRWDSASFKITGDLQNGNPDRTRWVPLRWFYFLPDASKSNRSASFDEQNRAQIEVWDPYDNSRGGTTSGWSDFRNCPIFYRWAIDERLMPTQVESLNPTSTF